MIERNLATSGPREGFAMSVFAALPAAAAPAAVGTSAVKGSLAAKSGLLGFLLTWLGLIGGVASGLAGSYIALRHDKTAADRKATLRFLVHLWLLVVALVAGCFMVFFFGERNGWTDTKFITVLSAMFSIYWAWIATLVLGQQRKPS